MFLVLPDPNPSIYKKKVRKTLISAFCDFFLNLYTDVKSTVPVPSKITVPGSVPDPPDPHVFGPPGSGSTGQRCGSGSFYHMQK